MDLHDPPDDTSQDDDLAFWTEVDRRKRMAEPGDARKEPSATPCEVCGRVSISVRQSRLPLPVSCAYCARCDQEGFEPIRVVEAFVAERVEGQRLGEWLELPDAERRHYDEILRRSLAFQAPEWLE